MTWLKRLFDRSSRILIKARARYSWRIKPQTFKTRHFKLLIPPNLFTIHRAEQYAILNYTHLLLRIIIYLHCSSLLFKTKGTKLTLFKDCPRDSLRLLSFVYNCPTLQIGRPSDEFQSWQLTQPLKINSIVRCECKFKLFASIYKFS